MKSLGSLAPWSAATQKLRHGEAWEGRTREEEEQGLPDRLGVPEVNIQLISSLRVPSIIQKILALTLYRDADGAQGGSP